MGFEINKDTDGNLSFQKYDPSENLKTIMSKGFMGKIEFRIDEYYWQEFTYYKVILASMQKGGEPIFVSSKMDLEEAETLVNVLETFYSLTE
jgi:hypothetical protein